MAIKLHSVQTLAQKATRADVYYRSKNPDRVANPRWNFAPPYSFQGSTSGYSSGGGFPTVSIIDKFPFASDANATDVGDLTLDRDFAAGQSSTTNGYTSGGRNLTTPPRSKTVIDKFPFASNSNATTVGDLSQGRYGATGQSSSVSGYSSGGYFNPSPVPGDRNTIDKFPFASDASATDVGDLTVARGGGSGTVSSTSGYTGGSGPPTGNVIDKFPFATNANATDVGDLSQGRYGPAGQSSTTNGYSSGGGRNVPVTYVNTIDKFPFASDANATDVGDLSQPRRYPGGISSTASGYSSGGGHPPPPPSAPTGGNVIDKFPFATDANATDVGDLTAPRYSVAGQQV